MRVRIVRWAAWALTVLALDRLSRNVEDGQFEREYSRLYMGVLLGILLVAAIVVAIGVGNLLTRRARSGK